MKKHLVSFKSVTDVLGYIKENKPVQYHFDPQRLQLITREREQPKVAPSHKQVEKRRIENESLANLLIELS